MRGRASWDTISNIDATYTIDVELGDEELIIQLTQNNEDDTREYKIVLRKTGPDTYDGNWESWTSGTDEEEDKIRGQAGSVRLFRHEEGDLLFGEHWNEDGEDWAWWVQFPHTDE